jgi:hypothetical protein
LIWILHPAGSACNALRLFAQHPQVHHHEEFNAKQFVMKRNKSLHVKKIVLKRQMLGDFKNALSAQSGGHPHAQFERRRYLTDCIASDEWLYQAMQHLLAFLIHGGS